MPIHHLKKLSAYSRTDDHVAERTLSGAVITILGALLMCVLFVNEVSIFMTPQVRHTMAVATDPTSGHEEGYSIWINVTFPALHCDFAGISEMDQSGGRQIEIDDSHDEHHGKREDSIIKWRLKHHTLGDVLGQYEKLDHRLRREGVFMSPIEMAQRRVTEALQDPEGCRLEGHVSVPRVKGTIVFGINGIFPVGSHIDNFQWVMPKETIFNLSHTFDTFTFGEALPGHNYNLHGVTRVFQAVQDTYGFTRYFLQVVPTIYRPARGREESTNQYSITEYFSPSFEGPAGWVAGRNVGV
mmetsp:Transcript_14719/g.46850  ORF Transcript_14719/g.46850 Transcript_14719/m.46850 type:complete len:298 (-) Transcript_14719:321-1214(-)